MFIRWQPVELESQYSFRTTREVPLFRRGPALPVSGCRSPIAHCGDRDPRLPSRQEPIALGAFQVRLTPRKLRLPAGRPRTRLCGPRTQFAGETGFGETPLIGLGGARLSGRRCFTACTMGDVAPYPLNAFCFLVSSLDLHRPVVGCFYKLSNGLRSSDRGRKGKLDGMSFDGNRLAPWDGGSE